MWKIFAFLLLFAFAEPLKLENVEFSKIAKELLANNKINIKGIIDELLKNIAGDKVTRVPLIEIDPGNRFQDIVIVSNVSDITNDVDGNLAKINIRNLTIPVTQLKVRGKYNFEGLSLFDLEIYGQGDIIVDITKLKMFFKMKGDFKQSRGWKITDIDVDTSVEYSFIKLDNLMDGEPMGEFLNYMVNELFKVGIDLLNGLVNENKSEVMKVVEQFLNSIFE